MWLDKARLAGFEIDVRWRAFVLDQGNRTECEIPIWELPVEERGRSLMALIAGKAAMRQGKFDQFHMAVLRARHSSERIRLDRLEPLIELAEKIELDIAQFNRDMMEPGLLAEIVSDHNEAVNTHGVFGTPTFVFENGQSAFVKTFVPPDDEAADALEHFVGLFERRGYIGEVKRPQPPWPKGAV